MIQLSIITINRNNANGLRRTFESVINQTYDNFEYIIIDGASTDESVQVIENLSTLHSITTKRSGINRSILWRSEPDKGIYNAMNKAIRMSRGKYLQFLNSGDWLASPIVIDKMMESLPDCSIFYGNMLKQFPNGKVLRDSGGEGKISMMTFYRGTLNHSPTIIERRLFQKYGMYDETLKIVSDWKWFLIAVGLNNETVKYINLDIVYFDMTGISNTNQTLEKEERRKILGELLPRNVLIDYDNNWRHICMMNRINKYIFTKWLFWILERVLFKYEKFKMKSVVL